MNLAVMVKVMSSYELLESRPEPPYTGIYMQMIQDVFYEIREPPWHKELRREHYKCDLTGQMMTIYEAVEEMLSGLEWDDLFQTP